MTHDEKICTSIKEKTVDQCINSLKGLKLAEIRIDELENMDSNGIKKIFSQPLRLVATCRPGKIEDKKRKELLQEAINAGAKYVDIEVESNDDYEREIIANAKKHNCKAIVSYHNYDKTPARAELEQIINWCFESGADIAKIACKVNSDKDSARLLGLFDNNRKMIVIGIGEKGKITRIISPLLGAEFTFAALAVGKETADGQMESGKMKKIMETMKEEI